MADPSDLEQLRQALADGRRQFQGLRLRDLGAVDLDLSGSRLQGTLQLPR